MIEGEMEMAWCDQNYALTDLVTEGVIEGEMKRPGLICQDYALLIW